MPQLLRLLLPLSIAGAAGGRSLLRQSSLSLAVRGDPEITVDTDIEEVTKKIHEKWDKMDDFLEIMYMLACTAKHGKDVEGKAAEALKEGEISGDEVVDFKKKIQKENINELMKACGMIVAKGEKPCRERCQEGYGDNAEERNECDNKCVEAYGKFEASCQAKTNNLGKIYDMKLAAANARKTCHEGHCPAFPTVQMMDDAAKQAEEVTKLCEKRCTDDYIKTQCEHKWTVDYDFKVPAVRSECFGKSKAKDCYAKKEEEVSGEEEKCQDKGKGTCEKQFDECNKKGETDKNFKEGAEFCDERKKMCESQVTDSCLKEHKAGLDKAEKECEKESEEELKTCEDETLEKMEKEEVEACVKEDGPKCKDHCADKDCNVEKMNSCLDKLKDDNDGGEMFCQDFWHLLHESSEVDPSTGNPIVLLAPRANVTRVAK